MAFGSETLARTATASHISSCSERALFDPKAHLSLQDSDYHLAHKSSSVALIAHTEGKSFKLLHSPSPSERDAPYSTHTLPRPCIFIQMPQDCRRDDHSWCAMESGHRGCEVVCESLLRVCDIPADSGRDTLLQLLHAERFQACLDCCLALQKADHESWRKTGLASRILNQDGRLLQTSSSD